MAHSRALTTIVGTLAAIFLTWSARAADPDLFARVAVGRLVVRDFGVPISDPFAFTLKKPVWIDHEWLSGVVFYLAVHTLGDAGIFLLRIIMLALTVWLVTSAMHASKRCMPFCLLAMVSLCTYVWNSPLRAQVFTYAALAGLGWIMLHAQRTQRVPRLYYIVAIFAAWTNLHGGVVAGLGLFLVYCACQAYSQSKQCSDWILVGLAALLGAALTPYGVVHYWGYLFDALTMSRPTIGEWAPLKIYSGAGLIWLTWIFILMLGMFKQRTQVRISELAVLSLATLAGLKANRLTAIAVILTATYGCNYFAAGCEQVLKLLPRLGAPIRRSFVTVLIFAGAFSTYLFFDGIVAGKAFKLELDQYPLAALDWLRSNREGGRILNDFNVGSFALWRLYPHFLISLDGRYETVYPDVTVEQVSCALNPKCGDFKAALDSISADYVLISTAARTAWPPNIGLQQIYSDSKFTILESSGAAQLADRERLKLWESDF